jgi:hypothetical protein
MFKLQREIYRLAKAHGACDRLESIKKCASEDELAELMYDHLDFCFKNNFPSNAIMSQNAELLARHGILSVRCTPVSHRLTRYILTGDALLNITASGRSVVFIYAKDNARANVTAKDNAIISFRGWGNSHINVTTKDSATALIYLVPNATCKERREGRSIIQTHRHAGDYL